MKKQESNVIPFSIKSRMRVPRFTFNAWMKIYPESNMKEWAEANDINSFNMFAAYAYSRCNEECENKDEIPENETTVLVITIDDEYFKWLGDKKSSKKTLQKYMSSITKEDAARLSAKNKMNISHDVLVMPVHIIHTVINKKSNFKLTKEASEALSAYLKRAFPELDLFVPGYVMKFDKIEEAIDDIERAGITFFEHGFKTYANEFYTQKYDYLKTDIEKNIYSVLGYRLLQKKYISQQNMD